MPSLSLLSVLLVTAAAASAATVVVLASADPAPEPDGHLVLQIDGDANALRVVAITPKPDPCGHARCTSEYAVVARDARGDEVGRVPLDLSVFDLDPARVGQAIRVEGCVLRDSHVATLANIPRWPSATTLHIVHGARVLGSVDGDRYAALIAAGARR